MKSNHSTKQKKSRLHPSAPSLSKRVLTPPRVLSFVALLAMGVGVVLWKIPAENAETKAATLEENIPTKRVVAIDREQALEIRRKLLTEVESKGLATLDMIDESWPETLRRSLRRDILEHHGMQHPLESLEWLAQHPKIEGSGPLGVELSFSLHARAGGEAGKAESWQQALGRLDRIATHGTAREHLAYLQTALAAMRTSALLPFSAKEINAMKLRPDAKAVALASLGDLRSGLDLLRPGGVDYPAAHLATREWLTMGKAPLSLSETANRLLTYTAAGELGPAEVARTLRHPNLDRSLALWLKSQAASTARDETLREIAADIALSDPSFAQALIKYSPSR